MRGNRDQSLSAALALAEFELNSSGVSAAVQTFSRSISVTKPNLPGQIFKQRFSQTL